jgi:hypothetical protein
MPQAPQLPVDVTVATFNPADDVPIGVEHRSYRHRAFVLSVTGG